MASSTPQWLQTTHSHKLRELLTQVQDPVEELVLHLLRSRLHLLVLALHGCHESVLLRLHAIAGFLQLTIYISHDSFAQSRARFSHYKPLVSSFFTRVLCKKYDGNSFVSKANQEVLQLVYSHLESFMFFVFHPCSTDLFGRATKHIENRCSLYCCQKNVKAAKTKGSEILDQTTHSAKVNTPSSRGSPSSVKMRCHTTSRSPQQFTNAGSSCMYGGPPSWSSEEQHVELQSAPPSTFSAHPQSINWRRRPYVPQSFRSCCLFVTRPFMFSSKHTSPAFFLSLHLQSRLVALPDLLVAHFIRRFPQRAVCMDSQSS